MLQWLRLMYLATIAVTFFGPMSTWATGSLLFGDAAKEVGGGDSAPIDPQAQGSFYHTDFFANAIRREPQPNEIKSMARLTVVDALGRDRGTCSSFFIKNNKNRLLMGTARHCLEYRFKEGCRENKFKLSFYHGEDVIEGRCANVVAGSPTDDFIVFEAQFETEVRLAIKPLALTVGVPPQKTRLRMLGFPMDRERRGRMTVTENCWLTDGKKVVMKSELDEEGRKEATRNVPSKNLTLAIQKLVKSQLFSNCSVYGGNSGGPIIVENTDYVIGHPRSYIPGHYKTLSSNYSMQIESSDGFVQRNRTVLEAVGVKIVDINQALSI